MLPPVDQDTTFNDPLNAARTMTDVEVAAYAGDTIYVIGPGLIYSEPPITIKDDQTVVGGTVVIAGGGGGPIGGGTFVFTEGPCTSSIFTGSGAGPVFICEGDATIRGLTFRDNTIPGDGAGIQTSGGELTVTNCCFVQLWASHGGAIYAPETEVTVTDCDFEHNRATVDGAGIYVTEETLRLLRGNILHNVAVGNARGGGIWALNATLEVTAPTVIDNHASGGGAAYLENRRTTWVGHIMRENIAETRRGGGIWAVKGKKLEVRQLDIIKNQAMLDRGGAIAAQNVASVRLERCVEIRENKAPFSGGALGNFPGGGGALHLSEVALCEVVRCVFTRNSASAHGGAISAFGGGTNTLKIMDDTKFIENFVDGIPGAGGAIAVSGTETFTGNLQGVKGGVIRDISGGAFTSNEVKTDIPATDPLSRHGLGGAIYAEGHTSKGSTQGLPFSTSKSSWDGGAIACFNAARLEVSGGSMDRNEATDDGGAIYVTTGAVCVVKGVQIGPMNKASENGGGIHVSAAAAIRCEAGTRVFANSAVAGWGGGISMRNARVNIDATQGVVTVDGNQAAKDGGGIAVLSADDPQAIIDIYPVFTSHGTLRVKNNACSGGGGGIYAAKLDQKLLVFQMDGAFEIEENQAMTGSLGIRTEPTV